MSLCDHLRSDEDVVFKRTEFLQGFRNFFADFSDITVESSNAGIRQIFL